MGWKSLKNGRQIIEKNCLHLITNGFSKQFYIQGFDFGSDTYKATYNLSDLMETAEYIYERFLEPYEKPPGKITTIMVTLGQILGNDLILKPTPRREMMESAIKSRIPPVRNTYRH